MPRTQGQGGLPGIVRGAGIGRRDAAVLVDRLNRDGSRIASRFGLVYRGIVAERPRVRGRYGICYEDGLIKIRLHHATRGTPLKYSSLVNTLCHELAHLKHFDHGEAFRSFYADLLSWARRESIYRPARRGRPVDPPDIGDCGVDPEVRRRFLDRMRAAAEGSPELTVPSLPGGQLPLFPEEV